MVRLQKALLEDEVLARKISGHGMEGINISVVVAVVHPPAKKTGFLCVDQALLKLHLHLPP